MSQPSHVCLSITPNLRCVGFTLEQSEALIIPPIVEVVISLLFIYSYSGPDRRAQILLVADSILYFVWTLLDMLHVVPAVRFSLSAFKALDVAVGAVSFTPILIYLIYLYRLSFRDFIPTLPRKLQPYLRISLPILLVVAVTINEVSSFVGTNLGSSSDQHLAIRFSNGSDSLWQSLSRTSLAIYTIIQFLFFLLAFFRLSRAFLDQTRIELARSDEHHYFRGISWITTGIIVGVVEAISGFAQVSFGVTLARRILRLSARAILMYGLLKGLDVTENFETLSDELRGVLPFSRRISRMLGVNPERTDASCRISHTCPVQAQGSKSSRVEKQPKDQRVTVHYETGCAPFLQIRFSASDLLVRPTSADMAQYKRRSLSGLIPGSTGTGSRTHRHGENTSGAARNMALETPRAKSLLVASGYGNHPLPDWIRPPQRVRTRQGSGATVSDRLSIVRELERRFSNLPPRITGKYRGSILGEKYEEDPFPVVGVSRQSSVRQQEGAAGSSEEGGTIAALSSSGSIKRKPAPPLLQDIRYISDRSKRPISTWGGLTQDTANRPMNARIIPVPDSPLEGTAVCSPDSTLVEEPSTARPRKTVTHKIIGSVSRPVSDASIRSAEWLASTNSPLSNRTPLTAADIKMYRKGNIGPGTARPKSGTREVLLSGDQPLPEARRSIDDAEAHSKPKLSQINRVSIEEIPMQTEHTATHTELASGCMSSHSSVNVGQDSIETSDRSIRTTGDRSRTTY